MANIPLNQMGYSMLVGSMLGAFVSKTGISRVHVGSPILSIIESVGMSQLRVSADIVSLLAAVSLDAATGDALQRIGNDENVAILDARAAGGYVTLLDTSFTKIASTLYPGLAAPIAGSVTIYLIDASSFPATGSVYIGRGTNDFEGPLAYTAKANLGAYWSLTLSSGTTRFHDIGEPIVVAQGGNRSITAGSLVQTPQANSTQSVQFRILNSVVIPDGETSVMNVSVVCQSVGSVGNVGAGDIQQFANPPFTGAAASNPTAFTNGRDIENDDDYRNRIRVARQTQTKGTKLTLTSSVIGLFSQTENKSIISSSYVTRLGEPDTLYIDDGTGYEEVIDGVAQDVIIASASGGEQYFTVDSTLPIAKAYLETTLTAPFALKEGATLSVLVGDVLSEYSFDTSSFRDIAAATVYEVVAAINGDGSLLFSARTANNASQVSIFAKTATFEYLQIQTVFSNDANDALGFPISKAETIRLFKNDQLLVKDGASAIAYSNSFGQWQPIIGQQTLIVAVDATPAVTYTFTDADFTANTQFSSIGINSLQAWVEVFNARIPGLTFSVQGSQLQIVSNKGNSTDASIIISGGSLIGVGMFGLISVQGLNDDYSFDRNTGQIKLTVPLVTGDTLVAGSAQTRAFVESDSSTLNTFATDADFWFGIDTNGYEIVPTGIVGTSALTVAHTSSAFPNWGYPVTISSTQNIFTNVENGDLAILWDPAFDSSLVGAWRVLETSPDSITIGKKNMSGDRKWGAATVMSDGRVLFTGGIVSTPYTFEGGIFQVYTTVPSSEIYDPIANTWTIAPNMAQSRGSHTSTLLSDGRVLVVGGRQLFDLNTTILLAGCEIYDPIANTWTAAAPLPVARYSHTAAMLSSGTNINKVIAVGGSTVANPNGDPGSYIYNPSGNTWTAMGNLTTGRYNHSMCILPNGGAPIALVVGGYPSISTAESLNTASLLWSSAGTIVGAGRAGGKMVYSPVSGKAEYYGGHTGTGESSTQDTNLLDRYDPTAGTWAAGATSTTKRSYAPWVLTSTGKIVTFGGPGGTNTSNSEIYDSSANTWAIASTSPLNGKPDHYVLGALLPGDNVLFAGGVQTSFSDISFVVQNYATSVIYETSSDSWSYTDSALVSGTLLTSGGVQIIRTNARPTRLTVAAASNYTASSLVSSLNSQLVSGFAQSYKTTQVRVSTNSFSTNGDIGLMTANVPARELDFPIGNAISSLVGTNGSVESSISEISQPYRLSVVTVGATSTGVLLAVSAEFLKDVTDPSFNLLFTKKQYLLPNETSSVPDINLDVDYGSTTGFYTPITSLDGFGKFDLRFEPELPILPGEPANAMVPYRFTWQDSLSVLVDQNIQSQDYQTPLARHTTPVGTTYSQTITLTDADNSNASLAAAFGFGATGFDFNDFAVAMHSRVLTDGSDATKRILWRWNRIGGDGDAINFEYVYANAANATPSISIDTSTLTGTQFGSPLVQLNLSSGAPVALTNFNSSMSLGINVATSSNNLAQISVIANYVATSASIATNVATLTLTLVPNQTDHGLQIGQSIYYSGDTGGVIPAGRYPITARTVTTISFGYVHGNLSPTALTNASVSVGNATVDFTGLSAGNLFHFNGDTALPDVFWNKTYRVGTVAGNFSYFTTQARLSDGYTVAPATTSWGSVNSTQNTMAFQNGSDTPTSLAALFTATSAITATATGSGSGTINESTAEAANDGSFYYVFSDGINYAKTTTIPGSISGNYSFVLKTPITSSLATNSDWANESVYLIPVTTQNCTDWIGSPSVSGVGNACSVARSAAGTKVQISTNTPGSNGSVLVQGGTANTTSIPVVGEATVSVDSNDPREGYILSQVADSNLAGFTANSIAKIQNTQTLARISPLSSATVVSNILTNGQIQLSSGTFGAFTVPLGSDLVHKAQQSVSFQKVGDYVLMTLATVALGYSLFDFNVSYSEGDWISIQGTPAGGTPDVSSANCGLFRIITTDYQNGVLYYNPNFIEETLVSAWVTLVSGNTNVGDYVIPSDLFSINTTTIGDNTGTRAVLSVGKAFAQSAIGGIVRASSTVTVQTAQPHGLNVGDYVQLTPGEALTATGWKLVVTVPTPMSFTYTEAGTVGASTLPQSWTGLDFQNSQILTLDVSATPLVSYSGSTTLGTSVAAIGVSEGAPATLYKFIENVIPGLVSVNDGPSLVFANTYYANYISEAAGSIVSPLGKFNFPTQISFGLDGYGHSVGLIEEASQTLYGDPNDPATYPGVVSAGNSVEISGPLIQRLIFGIAIRIQTGVKSTSIITKVQSAVAAVVNSSGVGENISFSAIIDAIENVVGIVSAVITYPTYDSLNDVIQVQNYEKALVLDAVNDIQVTLIGS